MTDRALATRATALAVALTVPSIAGLVVVLLADRATAGPAGGGDDAVLAQLATLLGVNAMLAAASHAVAAVAAQSLLRTPAFSASTLCQPAIVFAFLRPVGALVVGAGAFFPSLRQPLVGVALAMIDAAFVASLLLVVSSALRPHEQRARAVAAGYALVRVGSAVAVVSAQDAAGGVALAHRMLGAAAIAAVAVVLASVASALRRQAG